MTRITAVLLFVLIAVLSVGIAGVYAAPGDYSSVTLHTEGPHNGWWVCRQLSDGQLSERAYLTKWRAEDICAESAEGGPIPDADNNPRHAGR